MKEHFEHIKVEKEKESLREQLAKLRQLGDKHQQYAIYSNLLSCSHAERIYRPACRDCSYSRTYSRTYFPAGTLTSSSRR